MAKSQTPTGFQPRVWASRFSEPGIGSIRKPCYNTEHPPPVFPNDVGYQRTDVKPKLCLPAPLARAEERTADVELGQGKSIIDDAGVAVPAIGEREDPDRRAPGYTRIAQAADARSG